MPATPATADGSLGRHDQADRPEYMAGYLVGGSAGEVAADVRMLSPPSSFANELELLVEYVGGVGDGLGVEGGHAVPYTTVDVAALGAAPGPHPAASPYDKGVGAALGLRAFGVYQVELPPGAETVPHDHRDDGAEDMYAVLRGSGVVVVDGEEVAVHPGRFIAVAPQSLRSVRAGSDGLVFIAVCAPVAGR